MHSALTLTERLGDADGRDGGITAGVQAARTPGLVDNDAGEASRNVRRGDTSC